MPDERWCKRQAINIAAQLPDDPEDAKRVLHYAGELVGSFLIGEPRVVTPPRPVALRLVTPSEPHGPPDPEGPPGGEGGNDHPPQKSNRD